MSLMTNTLSKSNTVNKEINKRRKGAGAVSKNDNEKKMQNSSQHQVRQIKFLLHMVNSRKKCH